jgi:uncharacterized RDD family membrane protein YckC
MDFLPIRYSGQRVYAGFWKRFCAMWADTFIVMPIIFFFMWLRGLDKTLAMAIVIPSTAFFAIYHVYFDACYGGTLGKLAVGIRITKPDGSKIGWHEAFMRSAVNFAFVAMIVGVEMWILTRVNGEDYSNASGIVEQRRLLRPLMPSWFSAVRTAQHVWFWSELIVLLLNKRKRALHDFIAGTIVIRKEFLDIPVKPWSSDPTSDADWVNASRRFMRGEVDNQGRLQQPKEAVDD